MGKLIRGLRILMCVMFLVGIFPACGGMETEPLDQATTMNFDEGGQKLIDGEWMQVDQVKSMSTLTPAKDEASVGKPCTDWFWRVSTGPLPQGTQRVWNVPPNSVVCSGYGSQSKCDIVVEGFTELFWIRNNTPREYPAMHWFVRRYGLEISNCNRTREYEFDADDIANTVAVMEGNISCNTLDSTCFLWPRNGRAAWTHPTGSVYRFSVINNTPQARWSPDRFVSFAVR